MTAAIKRWIGNNRFFLLAVAILLFLNVRFDFYYIKTGSMEPALPVGTVVIVDTDANAVIRAQEGDIRIPEWKKCCDSSYSFHR